MFVPLFAFSASVNLSWDGQLPGDTRTAVRIFERVGVIAPYTYTHISTVPDPQNTYTVNNVTEGIHVYVVRAINSQYESPDSNAVSIVILVMPGNITSLSATIVP